MTFSKRLSQFCLSSKTSFLISIEVILGLFLCLFSLCIFIIFAKEILEKDTFLLDHQVSLFMYGLRTPQLTTFMIFISSFGDKILLIFAALISIIFSIKKHKKEAILFAIALGMGTFLNVIFKNMVQRQRPFISPLIIEHSYSFPSGHAMNSFIFYALIAYFSFHFFRNKKLTLVTSFLAGTLILLIGVSRIYLGVHYITDVIAGYIAGFWWFMTILLVEHTLVFYRLFKKSE